MKKVFFPVAALGLMAVATQAQVPPPPISETQSAVAAKLIAAIKAKDGSAYSSLLADDVNAMVDGRVVATTKQEWLRDFLPRFLARGVTYKVLSAYSSEGRVLLVEHYTTVGSWGGSVPKDCCWNYSAVAYDISGSKVTRIMKLNGGDHTLSQ